jgi:hypothetical protein
VVLQLVAWTWGYEVTIKNQHVTEGFRLGWIPGNSLGIGKWTSDLEDEMLGVFIGQIS